ncbi:cytochrome P450 [Streptomyces catenulae]|uniref:Cytochrome P450 n=1 Tax=Streptomyces catenulae TaxID=66875 RepID=A0ABV2Z3Y3_9ACTN|nr:cytochrome P450 [Streptomyces catenulae]
MTVTMAEAHPTPAVTEIPGPRGRPLVGNVPDYEKNRIRFLEKNHERYGDFFRFDAGSVVVRDPDAIHDCHVRTNTDFVSEEAIISDAPLSNAQTGPWMQARRPAWKALRPQSCLPYGAEITEAFAATVHRTGGRPFDPLRVFTDYTSAVLTRICLGEESPRVVDAVERRFQAFMVLMNRSWQRPRWLPDRALHRAREADRTLNALLRDRLERVTEPGPDLASTLMTADLGMKTAGGFLKGTLLAGYGVPAVSLTWIAHTLATDPRLAERVAAEARAASDLPTAYGAGDLPLAEAVVKEVLRLYPPTWLMGRRVLHATELGGRRLTPGETVLFSPYLVHRDPRWWDGADRLDPDRWLADTNGGARHRHAYLPYSGGTRVCIGSALGNALLILCTAHLAAHHHVAPGPAAAVHPHFGTMLTPRGLRLSCRPRRSA